jgi:hypothetical protein
MFLMKEPGIEQLWPLVVRIVTLARTYPGNLAACGTKHVAFCRAGTKAGAAETTGIDDPLFCAGGLRGPGWNPAGAFGGLTGFPAIRIPENADLSAQLFRIPELRDLSWLSA